MPNCPTAQLPTTGSLIWGHSSRKGRSAGLPRPRSGGGGSLYLYIRHDWHSNGKNNALRRKKQLSQKKERMDSQERKIRLPTRKKQAAWTKRTRGGQERHIQKECGCKRPAIFQVTERNGVCCGMECVAEWHQRRGALGVSPATISPAASAVTVAECCSVLQCVAMYV